MVDATTAAALQIAAAVTVGGIAAAVLAYVTGVDRVIRHPLQSFELALAIPMGWLPKPRRSVHRRHYRGRHRR